MGARTFTNWRAPKQYKISHIMSQEQYYLYPGGWQTQHLLGTTVGTNMQAQQNQWHTRFAANDGKQEHI